MAPCAEDKIIELLTKLLDNQARNYPVAGDVPLFERQAIEIMPETKVTLKYTPGSQGVLYLDRVASDYSDCLLYKLLIDGGLQDISIDQIAEVNDHQSVFKPPIEVTQAVELEINNIAYGKDQLKARISETATEIPINNGLKFPDAGTLKIGSEIIEYASRDETTITASVRGASGTTATEHQINEYVYNKDNIRVLNVLFAGWERSNRGANVG